MNNIITETLQETLEIVFGGKRLSYYGGVFIFSTIALILSLYRSSLKRDIKSSGTPEKFSNLFLFWDNTKRIVVNYLLIFLLARIFDLSNVLAMISVGFFVALGADIVIDWLMSKTKFLNLLKMDRESFPVIEQNSTKNEVPKSDNKD